MQAFRIANCHAECPIIKSWTSVRVSILPMFKLHTRLEIGERMKTLRKVLLVADHCETSQQDPLSMREPPIVKNVLVQPETAGHAHPFVSFVCAFTR